MLGKEFSGSKILNNESSGSEIIYFIILNRKVDGSDTLKKIY